MNNGNDRYDYSIIRNGLALCRADGSREKTIALDSAADSARVPHRIKPFRRLLMPARLIGVPSVNDG